jgi:predicted phosphohydrolase
LEFEDNRNYLTEKPIIPMADILILAGDIILFSRMGNHADFFDYLSENFKAVYWIAGNHEYYHSDMINRTGTFREQIRENIFLLNNSVEFMGNTRFIFSTLWSHISAESERAIQSKMNDFHLIKFNGKTLNPAAYNSLHTNARIFLSDRLKQKIDGKTIVITHHVPTKINYPQQYLGSDLNMAFATELTSFIETAQPDYWIYGHHHYNTPDFKIGKTVMLTNQLGYVRYGEHKNFNPKANFGVE